jgi:hypothetical protein
LQDKDGKKLEELKPESEWSKEEDELALGNSKVLNALFNGVDKNMFRLIKRCKVAKEAWEILITTQEGTSKVKNSRLQMLTTKFEELKMKEDESVHEFHMTILDYANTFDALGEKLSEEKMVRKMLRSLPKKFDMKVTCIEEFRELDTIKLDDLVGSLQTFEMSVNERSGSSGSKNKSIALVSNTDNEDHQDDIDTDESISDAMVLLGKQFNKVMRRMDRKTKGNVPNIRFDISKPVNNFRRTKTDDKVEQSKGVKCHEFEGFGHIRTECGTFLKRQKKSMTATWSEEDESEEEVEERKRRFLLLKPSKLMPLRERSRSVTLVSTTVYSPNISVITATIIIFLAYNFFFFFFSFEGLELLI